MAQVDVTRIASNIGALNALNSLQLINAKLAMHQNRLSTGKRINSAADDPAGLTIATKMMARSEGLKASIDNISDARNMLSVAEGGLSTMTDIMISMRSKAEKAASDTLGTTERATIQTQLSSYAQQLQDLVDQTKWNGVKLLDASTGTKNFQTGVDEGEMTTWKLPASLDPTGLSLSTVVESATATSSGTPASFVAGLTGEQVEPSGVLGNMTELSTGDYSFKILDKATSTAYGNVNRDVSSSLLTGLTSFTNSTATSTQVGSNVMTSGKYTVEITAAVSKDQTSYKLTKIGDTSFGDAGSISFNNINLNKQDRGMGAATNSVNVGAASVSNIVTDNTQLVSGAYTVETQVLGGASTTITTDDVYQFRIVDSAQKDVSFAATSGGAASANTTGWRTFYTGSPSATAVSYNTGLGVTIALTATGATTGLDASALTLTSGSFTYTQAGSNYNLLDSMAAKDALTGTYTQANHTLGIKMQSADFGSLKVGESMTFEYIAKGDIKFSLLDGSGAAQVLAQNSTGTVTGSVGYKQAGTSYVSGRGVSMKLAAFDTVKAEGGSNEQAFVYERANQYSVNVSTSSKAGAYMTTINTALDKVTSTLSDLGALMARLTYKEEQAATAQVNVEGAYSRIMNANMAEEQLNASKYTILQQTATAMLAQANAAPQSLLTLFR